MQREQVLAMSNAASESNRVGGARRTVTFGILFALSLVAFWMGADTTTSVAYISFIFGGALLALAVFDIHHGRLPNFITLPLIPAGLAVAAVLNGPYFLDHVIGAAVGWLCFAALQAAYRALRGVDGLGKGDVKLMAAAGAWLGWQGLPTVVLEASLLGLMWVLMRALTRHAVEPGERLPFGPFLCLANWITWLYGPLGIM